MQFDGDDKVLVGFTQIIIRRGEDRIGYIGDDSCKRSRAYLLS